MLQSLVRRLDVSVAAGVFAAVTAVAYTRQAGQWPWATIFAEDGSIFLAGSLHDSFWKALTTPYSGYIHLVPRLIAAVVPALPLTDAADAISAAAVFVTALTSVFVYFASAGIISGRPLRALVAALPVLLPVSGYESLATLANLHWFLIYGSFWSVVCKDRWYPLIISRILVVLLSSLSDPQTALLLPPALILSFVRRRPASHALWVVIVSSSLVQLLLGNRLSRGEVVASSIPKLFGLRVVIDAIVGDRFLDTLWQTIGVDLCWFGLALAVMALSAAVALASRTTRLFVVLCAYCSLVFFLSPMIIRGTTLLWPPNSLHGATRYFILPQLFLLTAAAVFLQDLRERFRVRGAYACTAAIAGIWLAATVTANYSVVTGRSHFEPWRVALAEAEERCVEHHLTDVRVEVAPSPAWVVVLPCSRLT